MPLEAAVVAVRVNTLELGAGFESQIDELVNASPDLVAAQRRDPLFEAWRLAGTEAGRVLVETLDHVNRAVFGREAGRMVIRNGVLLREVDRHDNLEATQDEKKGMIRQDDCTKQFLHKWCFLASIDRSSCVQSMMIATRANAECGRHWRMWSSGTGSQELGVT